APRRPGWGRAKKAGPMGGGGAVYEESEKSDDKRVSRMSASKPRAKARKRMQAMSRNKNEAMAAQSGAEAVSFADALKDMKQAEGSRDDADDAMGMRYVAGRPFRFGHDGTWVDLKFKHGMKILKVKYMSEAWFALSRKSGLLKQVFGLGSRLIVVVGKNKALEIGTDGKEKLSATELSAYLP
ncbi:MAG: hypothetical protein JRF33_27895, partial [Deltaproteobacteria bacterium]|nr:hypothetical protein [Deltaproteobacteria bacterium]